MSIALFVMGAAGRSNADEARQERGLVAVQTISHSCTISKDEYILPDRENTGAIRIIGDGLKVDFHGAELVGGAGVESNQFTGRGLSIRGKDITISNVSVRGYLVGVFAEDAPGLKLLNCDVSRNYRQRLKSGIEREDTSDWLYGHENDDNEWLRYGAGIYLLRCPGATVERCRARNGQNGLCVVRSDGVRVADNDMSFMSGWGLALWRSSECEVFNNKFDWCVRGYSHGAYARGQDSAGILVYEQCHRNIFANNSATHCGDGFFLYAGHETVQKTGKGGCNENIVHRNDFSHAVANGIEATFSGGNVFVENILNDCEHGMWAGYSYDSVIELNTINNCTHGVSVEHGRRNRISGNGIRKAKIGVHLWWDEDKDLLASEFCRVHAGCRSRENVITGNRFDDDETAIRLEDDTGSTLFDNFAFDTKTSLHLKGNVEGLRLRIRDDQRGLMKNDSTSVILELPPDDPINNLAPLDVVSLQPKVEAFVGHQQAFLQDGVRRGRSRIFVDEWGPYDFTDVRVFPKRLSGAERASFFMLAADYGFEVRKIDGSVKVEPVRGRAPAKITVSTEQGGVQPFSIELSCFNESRIVTGTLVRAKWDVAFRDWNDDTDPRKGDENWQRLMSKAPVERSEHSAIDFHWGHHAPSEKLPADRFATVATTSLSLPGGRWVVRTVSDDGIRLFVDDREVLSNWTWHPSTEDVVELALAEGMHNFRVEHFEIDGYAQLQFQLEPVTDIAEPRDSKRASEATTFPEGVK